MSGRVGPKFNTYSLNFDGIDDYIVADDISPI